MKHIIVISIFILLSGCDQTTPKLTKLPADTVILAFGDSLTYGTGASSGQDYPSILEQLTSLHVINAGVPGEISRDGLKRLQPLLDEHQPDLLILIHGGNDILRRIPAQQTADNIRQMIAEARQRNTHVIMMGVPQPGLFLMSSAEMYQQIAENQKIATDLETLPEILADPGLKSDRVHPNEEGYRIMAENIYRLLQENGAL